MRKTNVIAKRASWMTHAYACGVGQLSIGANANGRERVGVLAAFVPAPAVQKFPTGFVEPQPG